MNYIICDHYNMNYRCGKCLNEVFTTGQPLKAHMKVCKGLPKEAMNEASVGNADGSHTLPEKKKCMSKDPSPKSRSPPLQSSQESSQASPCRSQHPKKKPTLTPKKSDSSQREEECSSCHKHCGEDKFGEKASTNKHSLKKSHKKSGKKSSKKPSKKSSKDESSWKQSKDKCHEKEKPEKDKWHDQDKTGKDKSGMSSKK